jgi:alpha-L-arabinofuranosidase
VFGGFVEHLGRCIHGGLHEEGSPLSDDCGFRKDVLGLLRELRLGVLRRPGGKFVSNHHWADGIGPKDARPRRPELAWGGEESNRFGTDEFLAYCEELGTEPYICLNMGTGTPGRRAGLGRVLQLGRPHVLGGAAAGERARRAVPGHLLGAGQRRRAARGGVRARGDPDTGSAIG